MNSTTKSPRRLPSSAPAASTTGLMQIPNQPKITSFFTKVEPSSSIPALRSSRRKLWKDVVPQDKVKVSGFDTSNQMQAKSPIEITLSSDSDSDDVTKNKRPLIKKKRKLGKFRPKVRKEEDELSMTGDSSSSNTEDINDEDYNPEESQRDRRKSKKKGQRKLQKRNTVVKRIHCDKDNVTIIGSIPAPPKPEESLQANQSKDNNSDLPCSSNTIGSIRQRFVKQLNSETHYESDETEHKQENKGKGKENTSSLSKQTQNTHETDCKEFRKQEQSPNNDNTKFSDADTQPVSIDPFTSYGNSLLSNIDEDEFIRSATPTPEKVNLPQRIIEIGISSNNTSPNQQKKTPVKAIPKLILNRFSPMKHLNKDSTKLLFPSPIKTMLSQSSTSSFSQNSSVFLPPSRKNESSWPYFVENFSIILNDVINDTHSTHLLSEDDSKVALEFHGLSLSGKCLYVKLFQRTLTWYRQSKVSYEKIAQDLGPSFQELHQKGFLSEIKDIQPLPHLETILDMLSKDEMVQLAKDMNLQCAKQSNKEQCKLELLKMVKNQRTLSKFSSLHVVTKAALQLLGSTYRISGTTKEFFSHVFILYSLPQYWDDESRLVSDPLLTILLNKQGKMEYPDYKITKSRQIYRTRQNLVLFHEGLSLHSQMQAHIEAKAWEQVVELHEQAFEKLKSSVLSNESIQKNDCSLPNFLLAYTAGSVLTRAVWLGVEAYQKLKDYKRANETLKFLLDQTVPYCSHYRGRWYERTVINSKHLGQSHAEMKQLIINGLSDSLLRDDYRLGLSNRLKKIEESIAETKKSKCKANKKRKRITRSTFNMDSEPDDLENELKNPEFKTYALTHSVPERTIEAEQLHLGGLGEIIYGKSTFIGDGSVSNGNTISSVELRVMSYYKDQGYRWGLHGEGEIPIALYGLVFWDIIYMDNGIPDVFRCPFQPFPLDLHFDDFYTQRKEKIDEILHNLRFRWSLADAYSVIETNWSRHFGKLSLVSWTRISSLDNAKALVKAMGLGLLANISELLARNFRYYRSGFPDLALWNDTECLFVEVKSPSDKLSAKQQIWLQYLVSIGAKAEVCHVKAVSNKRIRV